jgi:hypothetical protein
MRPLLATTAALALSVATAAVAPKAEAARVALGIAVPGVAVIAPAPIVVAPAPFFYYGPRAYAPYIAAPVFCWRAHFWGGYGRPYVAHRNRH